MGNAARQVNLQANHGRLDGHQLAGGRLEGETGVFFRTVNLFGEAFKERNETFRVNLNHILGARPAAQAADPQKGRQLGRLDLPGAGVARLGVGQGNRQRRREQVAGRRRLEASARCGACS